MQAVNKTVLTRLTRLTRLYENSCARFKLKKIRISATTKVLLYRPLESGMFSSNSSFQALMKSLEKKIANVSNQISGRTFFCRGAVSGFCH